MESGPQIRLSGISRQLLSMSSRAEKCCQTLRFPSERDEEITEARHQRDGVNQELSRVETKINLVQESIKGKKKEAQGDRLFLGMVPWLALTYYRMRGYSSQIMGSRGG